MKTHPLKILHFICSTGFYGAEKWILALANNTDRNQITSELVVTRETENEDLQLAKEFTSLGLQTHHLPMSSRFDIRAVNSLVKLIKEQNIDVIHTHGYKSDIIGLLAGKRANIKCVTTPHGFEKTSDWKLKLFISLGCKTFKYFDYVVPLSKELLEDVTKLGVAKNKIVYIQNGVDLKHVNYRSPSDSPESRSITSSINLPENKTIGFIGQMIDRKNVDELLNVFDSLAADNSGLNLVLLGDGTHRQSYEKIANELASAPRIKFLGFQNDPISYLKTFDLFVMSSKLEGIPRCLMEAMAVGVPVAAYNIPGVNQLIHHNETGLLAPFGDRKALAQCCKTLLWDEPLANKLSRAASKYIQTNFSAHRMAQEYTALYYKLFENKTNGQSEPLGQISN